MRRWYSLTLPLSVRSAAMRSVNRTGKKRRKAEPVKVNTDLIEQSRIAEAFFKYSISPLVFLDKKFNFIQVNNAFAKVCGRDISDFNGHNHFKNYPSDELKAEFERVVATKEPYSLFARPFKFADHPEWGVTYWDLFLYPVLDGASEVDFLAFSLNDVTERKKTEEALQKYALEIQDLYNNAPCGYHSLDKDSVYVRINDTELKWLGYSREEVIGKMKFTDVLTEESKKTSRETFPLFKAQGWIRDLEFDMIRKDGTIMPVLLNATAIKDGNGYFLMSRSTLFDIADHKQAEEEKKGLENQLIQNQKMEALGRLAGGIAHDMNNVLYPIIIDTEMLLEETEQGTRTHEILQQILSAAYRQRDLVKQIVSFSRRSEKKHNRIKITPLVKETVKLLRSSLPSTIEIKKHINASSDVIMGDPTQIQQILMNLCKNAVDSLGTKAGTIEVKLVNTHLEPAPDSSDLKEGQYLHLTVRDTGSGIQSEIMDRIFEPFFTTKEVGKGSGMGLAVVHGILKSHGGAITVKSEPGKGSQFDVYLPVNDDGPLKQMPGEDIAAPMKGKEKILLVDDEEIILSSLQKVLKGSGYNVVAVKDGLEALKLFNKTPDVFDLVITDLTMPRITGVDLARKLKDIRSDIPIILCTGFSDIIDEKELEAMGVCEMLLKPANLGDLHTAVRRALEY